LIDLAILGLLTEQELHGYELKKRLGELLSNRASISFGSLYPALARLEAQGAVKAVEQRTAVPSAPMSGSLVGELAAFRARVRESGLVKGTGRGKKVYGITEAGRARLVELLADPDVSDDRAFTLRVAFATLLPDPARMELFERRRTELLGRRDDLRRREGNRGRPGRNHPYLGALLERDAENLAHDLAWLDRLIDAERSRSTVDGPTQAHLQEEPT
jgi:DNA-binding PadR family transcriptional regulator